MTAPPIGRVDKMSRAAASRFLWPRVRTLGSWASGSPDEVHQLDAVSLCWAAMPSDAPASFAELLTQCRTHGGWTRGQVAVAAGISTQFVTYLETGDRRPSDETVERLITALDLKPRTAGLFRRLAAADR